MRDRSRLVLRVVDWTLEWLQWREMLIVLFLIVFSGICDIPIT